MTRLLVECSIEEKISLENIDFGRINNWYSEGLLSSPFLARIRGDCLAEGYTHTDIALGDFFVDSAKRGDISIKGHDGIFGVIEAKLGSRLSVGTKNAPSYNQASRNLACIAFNTRSTTHKIFFAVVAPEKKIDEHGIREQVSLHVMLNQIADRFDSYNHDSDVYAMKDQVIGRAKECMCGVISYETWLDKLSYHSDHSSLMEFKEQCYRFNRIN